MTPTTHSRWGKYDPDKTVLYIDPATGAETIVTYKSKLFFGAEYQRMLRQREKYAEVYAVAAKYLPEPGPVEPTLRPYPQFDLRAAETLGRRDLPQRQLEHLQRMVRAGENRWSEMRLDTPRYTGKGLR